MYALLTHRVRLGCIGLIVLVGRLGASVFAVTIPNGAYIVDEAEIFGTEGEEQITRSLKGIEDAFGVQGVVVSVSSLEGGSIQEQATNLGNFLDSNRQLDDNIFERSATEGVGAAGTNLGFLFLIAPTEQEWFIASGLGMEKYITDGEIAVAGSRILPGSFSVGDYALGVVGMIDRIESEVEGGGATLPEQGQGIGGLSEGIPTDLLFFLVLLAFSVGPAIGEGLKNHTDRAKYAGVGGGMVGVVSALLVGRTGLLTGGVFFLIFYIALHMKPGAGGTGPGRSRGGFGSGGGGRSFGGGSFTGGGGGGKR